MGLNLEESTGPLLGHDSDRLFVIKDQVNIAHNHGIGMVSGDVAERMEATTGVDPPVGKDRQVITVVPAERLLEGPFPVIGHVHRLRRTDIPDTVIAQIPAKFAKSLDLKSPFESNAPVHLRYSNDLKPAKAAAAE